MMKLPPKLKRTSNPADARFSAAEFFVERSLSPLYPGDAATRQRALALEDYFDEQLDPALRAVIVTPLFRHDQDVALRVLTTGMPDNANQTLRQLGRIFPAYYPLSSQDLRREA